MPKPVTPTDEMLACIREYFGYCPDTGCVYWIKARRGSPRAQRGPGHNAGARRKDGYVAVTLMGRGYLCHRIALYLHTGEWPREYVDHINGDTTDNRAVNLRPASTAENVFNSRVRSTNKLGVKGVSRNRNRFTAEIWRDGKRHYLGCFVTVEEASAAYARAAETLHGDFARGRAA